MSRILVVDDDEAIRRFVTVLLEDEGHEVVSAVHGADALDVVAADDAFDLIVLDMRMPVMDGSEFLEQVAGRDPQPRMLVMTAARDLTEQSPAVRNAAHISKPFDLDAFLASVGRLLDDPPTSPDARPLADPRSRVAPQSQHDD